MFLLKKNLATFFVVVVRKVYSDSNMLLMTMTERGYIIVYRSSFFAFLLIKPLLKTTIPSAAEDMNESMRRCLLPSHLHQFLLLLISNDRHALRPLYVGFPPIWPYSQASRRLCNGKHIETKKHLIYIHKYIYLYIFIFGECFFFFSWGKRQLPNVHTLTLTHTYSSLDRYKLIFKQN